ncbi:serine hydrolase domain-containing protein [Nocardiopsis protaetiae]|uniref:serine hydrolase domain-containing protein n=1 Tax=Nocardiopsis protaetiae TaxID=3382270 RepID=UPI00387ACB01
MVMKAMSMAALVATVAVVWAGPAAAAAAAPVDGLTAAAVDARVQAYLEGAPLPGVAVAVTRGSEVVRAAGYGVDSRGEPVGADTPMGVASVSKAFTALVVASLVEEGRLGLDDPVVEHLPEFAVDDPRSARITVRQLLTHTSGMSDRGFREKSEPAPADLEGAVARLADARLVADPGAERHYHNPNYQVAARMVEVVEGEPFAEVLRERVLEPLGMADTATVDTAADVSAAGVAPGHVPVLGRALALPEPEGYFNGSGGMVSTAADMARWLVAQNTGGRAADGGAGVPAGAVALTHAPAPRTPPLTNASADAPDPAAGSGLGWQVRETDGGAPLVVHGGIQFTYTAHHALLPESGVGIAVMAGTGLGAGDASALLWDLVALAEGRGPTGSPAPWLLTLDLVCAAAVAAVAAGAVRGVRRAGLWARDGRRWRRLPGAVGAAAVVAAALVPHRLLSSLAGGRDATWVQTLYTAPSVVVLLVAAAVALAVVWAVRLRALAAHRRPGPARELSGAGAVPAGA